MEWFLQSMVETFDVLLTLNGLKMKAVRVERGHHDRQHGAWSRLGGA